MMTAIFSVKSGLYLHELHHKKEPNYFFCNVVKNQRILIQFSLLDLQMHITCGSIIFTYVT